MKRLLVVLVVGCSTPTEALPIWRGETRLLANHWVIPSIHARDGGTDLQIDLAIPVASESELDGRDIAVQLDAGGTALTCTAQRVMGFTETLAITAQAEAHCANPSRTLPTGLLVRLAGASERYEIRVTSLDHAI